MLCQKCHKKTASVFISSIINGQETRMYLCSDCVKDYPLFDFKFQEPFSMKDVMDKFKIDKESSPDDEYKKLLNLDKDSEDKNIICPNCHSTYEEYKKTGKLGCSICYEAFENQLNSILKNIYGYEEYLGKIPKKDDNQIHISNEIRILKEDLNRAVEQEEYEKAADIRDKIKDLEQCNE
ncbi:UvrB/UvrC motif-containing protein [Terrisporobacter sp.]